jgi:hypothetical protein
MVKGFMTMKIFNAGKAFLRNGIVLAAAVFSAQAAPLTNLFNSGVNESGALLERDEVDPHYTITISADPSFPGPEAYTLLEGFPVGPWLEEGPDSRWLAPQANQSAGNEPGFYTFATSFDLGDLDPATAQITGQLSADNNVASIRLNGLDLGIPVSGGFNAWTPFSIPVGSPFNAGVNTLEFDVSNAGDAINPVGFRVEMTGRAVAPGEPPAIITSPRDREVIVGASVSFTVGAEGAPPLEYEWQFNGEPIANATEATLTLSGVSTNQAGAYTVTVSNAQGETNSVAAILAVLEPFPGIYNTGVNENRVVLEDGMVDPHYRLTVNTNDPLTAETMVQDSTLFPIVTGPWLQNSDESKWIGPLMETSAALGGGYVYELMLNLDGYDPATAFLAGSWASDNDATLFLNGADTGFFSPGFGSFSTFRLTNGFVSGTNRLEFRVNNAGAGYTGLRVENLRGTATEGAPGQLSPRVVTQPRSATRVITDQVTFTVVADGTAPLTYQWLRNGTEITNATSASLNISPVLPGSEGSYSVRVSNSLGSTNSEPATLTVVQPQIGVFNTGLGADGAPLELGQADPHYVLLESGDPAFPPLTAYAAAGAPIPPWLLNDEDSQWITIRPSGTDAAPGTYRYRLIFNIAEDEVATAAITAGVGTDDTGSVLLNGTPVEFTSGGFGGLSDLLIPEGSPFVAGLNTLDFVIANGGAAANPTGLRVDNIVITGVTIIITPALSVSRVDTDIRIAWPVSAEGFTLQETGSLPGEWTDSPATAMVEGNENIVMVPIGTGARFYRLIR